MAELENGAIIEVALTTERPIIDVNLASEQPVVEVKVIGSGPPGPPGRDGASTWNELQNKPFERIGDTLKVEDGTLDVNIYETENPSGGNTLYIGG